MKRFIPLMTVCALTLFLAGCSSGNGKVNVIKGPGRSGSNHLVSISQVRPGRIEGFLGKSDDVLVSIPGTEELQLIKVNSNSGRSSLLTSIPKPQGYTTVVSPDGRQVLINNYLVDTGTGSTTALPGFISDAGYSFAEDGELVLTDPAYYIKRLSTSRGISRSDTKNNLLEDLRSYSKEDLLDIQALKEYYSDTEFPYNSISIIMYSVYGLGAENPKLVFISSEGTENDTSLYVFDFIKKEFTLIDNDVKAYSVSPDRKHIAYIKTQGGKDKPERLCVAGMSGSAGKEIAVMTSITGLSWSAGGNWIAFSGADTGTSDIWVVKSDGAEKEQLTNGLNVTGKLSWSGTGTKIAFTSSQANTSGNLQSSGTNMKNISADENPAAFIATVNIDEQPSRSVSPSAGSKSSGIAGQLMNIIRKETEINLDKK